MSRKIRRHFTDDFKQQIVDLHNAGMKRSELIKEYDLPPLAFDTWTGMANFFHDLISYIECHGSLEWKFQESSESAWQAADTWHAVEKMDVCGSVIIRTDWRMNTETSCSNRLREEERASLILAGTGWTILGRQIWLALPRVWSQRETEEAVSFPGFPDVPYRQILSCGFSTENLSMVSLCH